MPCLLPAGKAQWRAVRVELGPNPPCAWHAARARQRARCRQQRWRQQRRRPARMAAALLAGPRALCTRLLSCSFLIAACRAAALQGPPLELRAGGQTLAQCPSSLIGSATLQDGPQSRKSPQRPCTAPMHMAQAQGHAALQRSGPGTLAEHPPAVSLACQQRSGLVPAQAFTMALALAAAQPACASSKHTAAAARQQAACLAAPRLSSGARRAFVAGGSSSRAVQRSSSVVVKVRRGPMAALAGPQTPGAAAAAHPGPRCPATCAVQAVAAEAATELRK